MRRAVLQRAWNEARGKVGMEHFHFHDLRHRGNTLAAATGASTRELMARMGHASAEAALRYPHATRERDQAIAAALGAMASAADRKASSLRESEPDRVGDEGSKGDFTRGPQEGPGSGEDAVEDARRAPWTRDG